ncbi:protein LYRIC-like isoform X3 [Sparus aurata]|uniref:protein LYRIC-like isoform X3 n=1 Tax=Sparus aurata TaxID=8175 RepID=UPI0011C13334|nr:protein LYRIC-like isoform X3 [Sparus aurata]
MEQWQDAASQQVKLLTNRVNELLSKGLGLLRSELGVDLGLKPELIPPWVILLAACTGLVLMVALWASTCRAIFKKRPAVSPVDDGLEVKRGVSKPVKSEEPKKKKKKAEKKAQSNGRAVAEPQEEAIVSEEIVPHHQPPPQVVKTEKVAETKKSKKKAKQSVKESKTVTDGKEPEEGTWETKVSNKEKREQRKKDKSSSDGSASPGGGDTPVSTPPEQLKAPVAPAPANQKKKKGESAKVKAEKVEAVVPQVNSSEVAAVPVAMTDMAVNVPAHAIPTKTVPWATNREQASRCSGDIDESWTVIEAGIPTSERNLVSLAGLSAATAEPQPVMDLPWLSQHRVDDEWSGISKANISILYDGGSVDPSSDWNAPSEVWGNYEEPAPQPPPTQEQPIPESAKANLLIAAADDDEDEKDKGESAADGSGKTKKKKKKKKKAAEEAAGQGEEPEKEAATAASVKKQPPVQENTAAVQPVKTAAVEARVEQPVKDNISQKPPVTQVPQKPTDGEPTAKQNNLSAPTQQKKPEEIQAPKPAKKKKARRET